MRRPAFTLALLPLALATPAFAQAPAPVDDLPRIQITDPTRNLLRLAVPNAYGEGELAKQASDYLRRDFEVVGLFQVLDPVSFPAALLQEGMGFSSALWTQVGAQGVSKVTVGRDGSAIKLEARLYQVGRGEGPVVTKSYRGPELRSLVHDWANEVIQQFTGLRGVFGSHIFFTQTGRSTEVASVGMDGAELKVLTKMNSECLLPAVSPTGKEVVFTSYLFGGPDLWLVSAAGGRARRISSRSGMNSGATWLKDGSTLAITLSHEGNPEIYKIKSSDGSIVGRLTHSSGADFAPSLSPDGNQVAFVSDRQGSPQLFLMTSTGTNAKRLTFQGSQNTTPNFNPRPDKPLIAFTGRDERATFDIFIYDLRTGKVDRVTQSKGSNYDPSWSPDGRLLVYASNRGGLFVYNPDTKVEVQIYKGGARNPAWGPAGK